MFFTLGQDKIDQFGVAIFMTHDLDGYMCQQIQNFSCLENNEAYRMSPVANLETAVNGHEINERGYHSQQCALMTLSLFFKLSPSRISKIP